MLQRWLAGLRFPTLFVLFAALFAVDFVVPDVIPLVDELLLGVGTILLASLRRRRGERPIDVSPPKP